MDSNTPKAAGGASAPQTEATPINTNTEAQAPQTAQPSAQGGADLHGFTSEQLVDMKKFFDSQGGYEKSWPKMKSRLSNPQPIQPTQPQQPETPTQPQPTSQPQQPEKPVSLPQGFVSQAELNVERYFKDLASEEKYSSIADKITSGSVLKEMASMGMNPIDENYNINTAQVKSFLDLKAAAVPAQPVTTPISNTPTVDYVEVGENITSKEQALQIKRQSMEARSRGLPPHPAEQKATEYLKTNWGK